MPSLHKKNHSSNLQQLTSAIRNVPMKAGPRSPKRSPAFSRRNESRKSPVATCQSAADGGPQSMDPEVISRRSLDHRQIEDYSGDDMDESDVEEENDRMTPASASASAPARHKPTENTALLPTSVVRAKVSADPKERPLPPLPPHEDYAAPQRKVGFQELEPLATTSSLNSNLHPEYSGGRPTIKRSQSENESVSSATGHGASLEWELGQAKNQIADLETRFAEKDRHVRELQARLRIKEEAPLSPRKESLVSGAEIRRPGQGDKRTKSKQDADPRHDEHIRQLQQQLREKTATVNIQAARITENLDKIYDLNGRVKSKDTLIGEYEQQLQYLESLHSEQCEQYESQNQRLKDVQREWKKVHAELTTLTRPGVVYKVDDGHITGRYSQILYGSRNWTVTYCGTPGGRSATSEFDDCLRELTSEYVQYLASKHLRPVLLQSLIMHTLWKAVFRTVDGGLVWAGKLGDSFRELDFALRPGENADIPMMLRIEKVAASHVKEYCAWRAQTTMLIAGHVDRTEIDPKVDDILDRLRHDLEPFITAQRQSMWSELREIIVAAVALDKELRKMKTVFAFTKYSGDSGQGWGFPFDAASMEQAVGFDAARPGSLVELVVAPFLVKIGNADGTGYEIQQPLSKSVVITTEARKKAER